jgi:hypothetical protein
MTEKIHKGPRVKKPETQRAPRASDRESRGPETSHFPEDDTFSVESGRKPRADRDFDEDLVR